MSIPPGKAIGLLGGGQLGRMTALAARRMGFRIHVFDPDPDCPAAVVADTCTTADWTDAPALAAFARKADVVTIEFENIPRAALDIIASTTAVHPDGNVLETCQNRARERGFLARHGYPQPAFVLVDSPADLASALATVGTPAVLKTTAWGYDGKGQVRITGDQDAGTAWAQWGGSAGIVEQWIDFALELSVICARNASGQITTFPPAENIHTNHILDLSIVPGRFPGSTAREAARLATSIASDLGLIGLIGVEMFLTRDGRLLVNELAPRPHNSGHYTLDACATSQFEQHARAVCNLPPGSTRLLTPAVMANLLGDIWANGDPDWTKVLRHESAKLHLYGKTHARPGRKMGHFCVLADDAESALATALEIKADLAPAHP